MSKIVFENIKIEYNNVEILKDVNFSINDGEFICIIGPSGCGKTSLLKTINLLIKPKSGKIYIDDKDIFEYNKINLRRKIGYATQKSTLFPHLSVYENISFVPSLINKKIDIEKCLEITSLDRKILSMYPDELSGGQLQRVSIARALANNPDILLMDEPFSSLDEITRKFLQKEIKKIHNKTNKTIIFITHDIEEAVYLADKILVLNNGKIEEYASPNEIINSKKSEFIQKILLNR